MGLVPFKKMGRYLIVNARFLRGGTRTSIPSLVNGAFFYSFIKSFERRFDTVLLTGGINSQFLNYVNLEKCILIINSIPFSPDDEETRVFAGKFAPRLRGIIVQSHRTRDKLVNMGIDQQKLCLLYPWIDLCKFKYTDPPNAREFRILFASAPNLEDSH